MKRFLITLLFIVSGSLWGMEVDEPQQPKTVWIQTSDDAQFEVLTNLIQRSVTLKNMLKDLNYETSTDWPAPLPNVDSKTFQAIEKALKSEDVAGVIAQLRLEDLMAFTNAVNFLDIPDLREKALSVAHNKVGWNEIFANLSPDLIKQLWKMSAAYQWISSKAFTPILTASNVPRVPVFSPDGMYLFLTLSPYIEVFNTRDKFASSKLEHKDVQKISFSPNGKYMLSQSENDIKIWDMENNFTLIATLQHNDVRKYGFSPQGRFLITQSFKEIKIWNADGFANFKSLHLQEAENMYGYTMSHDDKYLAARFSNDVKVWNLQQDVTLVATVNPQDISDVAFTPDNGYMIVTLYHGLQVFDVNDNFNPVVTDLNQDIRSFILSPDDRYLISWSLDGVQVWDADSLRLLHELPHKYAEMPIFSPDGTYMVSLSADEIKIWNTKRSFQLVTTLAKDAEQLEKMFDYPIDVRQAKFTDAIFSPDGKYLISLTTLLDTTAINVWDVDHEFRFIESREAKGVSKVICTHDYLISRSEYWKTIKIWNMKDNFTLFKELKLEGDKLTASVVNSDGTYMVTCNLQGTYRDRCGIKVWNLQPKTFDNLTLDQIKLLVYLYDTRESQEQVYLSSELYSVYQQLSLALQSVVQRHAPHARDAFAGKNVLRQEVKPVSPEFYTITTSDDTEFKVFEDYPELYHFFQHKLDPVGFTAMKLDNITAETFKNVLNVRDRLTDILKILSIDQLINFANAVFYFDMNEYKNAALQQLKHRYEHATRDNAYKILNMLRASLNNDLRIELLQQLFRREHSEWYRDPSHPYHELATELEKRLDID